MHKKGDYYNWLMQKEKTWYDERVNDFVILVVSGFIELISICWVKY